MSELIPQDLSELSMDELKTLQTKIQLLLELQEKFVFVPIAQAQETTHNLKSQDKKIPAIP